jgi:transcriptional regulator with XRE-family HTH domain
MDGWALRELRRKAGLTAAQVARATGTSETNVAAYERGDKVPGPLTRERLTDAIAAGSESPIFVNRLVTVPEAAASIRHGLKSGWSQSELLRIVREHRANFKWVSRPADRKIFFGRPSTTGDRRWDALLAGSSDDLLMRAGVAVPEWTKERRLTSDWFVADSAAFHEYLALHSPEPFRKRGVMVDPDALESV